MSFTPTVAASAIAAPFAAWPVVCCCCEGDGALVKKDVIGAAGFCGVAFLADIVDTTIERLSLFVPCVTAERTRSVGVRACCRRRALSGCDGKQRGIYRFAFKHR